jgi:hypothetical protein
MQTVYIVQVRGWGDDEDSFYNVAACSSRELANTYIAQIQADYAGQQVQTQVDEMPLVNSLQALSA